MEAGPGAQVWEEGRRPAGKPGAAWDWWEEEEEEGDLAAAGHCPVSPLIF